jgi:hypothetical protein
VKQVERWNRGWKRGASEKETGAKPNLPTGIPGDRIEVSRCGMGHGLLENGAADCRQTTDSSLNIIDRPIKTTLQAVAVTVQCLIELLREPEAGQLRSNEPMFHTPRNKRKSRMSLARLLE